MNEKKQYAHFRKPSWAPPSWLFGVVWTALYIIIAISFGSVFYKTYQGEIAWQLALPFALNLIFNFAFTPIQFGLKNNTLATIDIFLVVGTLIWALIGIWPEAHWVTYINLPYVLWGLFATALQLTITKLNK